jgi:hypothetical protein
MSDKPPSDQDTVFTFDPTVTVPKARQAASAARGAKTVHEKRQERVYSLIMKVGTTAFAVNQFDGLCIIERAEEAAEALATLADENKGVAKVIDNMTLTGGYLTVAAVILSMIAPILAYHGIIPQKFGLPVIAATAPESAQAVLAAQMAEQMARQQADGGNPAA